MLEAAIDRAVKHAERPILVDEPASGGHFHPASGHDDTAGSELILDDSAAG